MVDRDDDRLRELEEKYEGYEVYDNAGEKIGKVDDLFIDETDREEYIGVKMGLFGLSGKTLIPMELARVDQQERTIEVAASKDQVKNAPHYHDDDDIDHEFEARIREYFGLEGQEEAGPERGTYGRYDGATLGAERGRPLSSSGEEDRDDLVVGHERQHREDLGGTTEPIEERTTMRGVDEPLEPREETGDEALDRPAVVLVRVRRVRTL
jgi:sporulation protein YlmC with PRC-barrel domain